MLPTKTISMHTQDGETQPIKRTESVTTIIRAMGTKNIGLDLNKCYSFGV